MIRSRLFLRFAMQTGSQGVPCISTRKGRTQQSARNNRVGIS